MKALVVGGTGSVGKKIVGILSAQGADVFYSSRATRGPLTEGTHFRWDASEKFVPPKNLICRDAELLLFYCVGLPSSKQTIRETKISEFERLFQSNALGLIRVYQAIKNAGQVRLNIIAISSDATLSARPNNGPYTISKVALETIARTIAFEDGESGTRINVLAPSLIDSPMARKISGYAGRKNFSDVVSTLPNGRALVPAEVARAAIEMSLSKSWSYTNGQVFRLGAPPR